MIHNALWVLVGSVLLVVLGGLVARTFFFRRDPDDTALHTNDDVRLANQTKLTSHEPEP